MLTETDVPAVQTFTDATIYLRSEFMGIARIDCKSVTITRNVKYAQYENAIRVEYLQKGKRKPCARILAYKPFIVILPTSDAISPDAVMGKEDAAGCSQSRHSSCAPEWVDEFMAKLVGITPLLCINQ